MNGLMDTSTIDEESSSRDQRDNHHGFNCIRNEDAAMDHGLVLEEVQVDILLPRIPKTTGRVRCISTTFSALPM